jgi:tannase/feruloyl esterase
MRHTIAGAIILVCASANIVRAQAFADLKGAAVDYSKSDLTPSMPCENLARFTAPDIASVHARMVPATGDTPVHCRVSGVLKPEIGFEVNLPMQWNGRLYMIGNGGHAGESPDDPNRAAERTGALKLGFVMVSTNTGHDGRKEPGASFVVTNPQKAIDYAYRAVHLTATTGKDIAKEFYTKPVVRSYWSSCSNGGRQGLIEAQRYPTDFDGIVANAPWVDQTGFTIGAMWNQHALSEAPVSPAKLALVAERVMAKCDRVDGLADGIIDDPRRCNFDPAKDMPSCPAGKDDATCLTPAQADALMKVYSGPVNSQGKQVFPGFMFGSEAVAPPVFGGAPGAGPASGWMNVIVAEPGRKPADFSLAEETMRYLVFTPPRPDYDYRTFNFDRDTGLLDAWGKLANANNPDLSVFNRRGGKLIMTYGWADSILMPMMGVNYYERAVSTNGPKTRDFFRLFMVPGMAHCGGGVGPDQSDAVSAVIDWVEKGKAPDSIVASKITNGRVVRTRPLCPYPQVARYKGDGSIDEAANFRCVAP